MTIQREKQKKAGTSSLTIGNGLETCPSAQAADTAEKELAWYPFYLYKARRNFDPIYKMKRVEGIVFEHGTDLEDYWANAADSFEIKRRFWSRIPLGMVRATKVFRVADQVEDNPELEQPSFEKIRNEPLALIDWADRKNQIWQTL